MGFNSITLNGTAFSGNFGLSECTINGAISAYEKGCFGGLSKTGHSGLNFNSSSSLTKIQNPVRDLLVINTEEKLGDNIKCFDALGKSYQVSQNSSSDNKYFFDVKNLAAGMYLITINNVTLKFIKL